MKHLLFVLCLVSLSVSLSACQPERDRRVEPTARTPSSKLTLISAPERTPTTRSITQVDIRAPTEGRQAVVVSPVGADGQLVEGTDGMPWWNDTVFYEVLCAQLLR